MSAGAPDGAEPWTVDTLSGPVDLGSNYRRSLLYELPTFVGQTVGTTLLATSGTGDGVPSSSPSPSVVPLPPAGALLLAAAAGLAALRRRG